MMLDKLLFLFLNKKYMKLSDDLKYALYKESEEQYYKMFYKNWVFLLFFISAIFLFLFEFKFIHEFLFLLPFLILVNFWKFRKFMLNKLNSEF